MRKILPWVLWLAICAVIVGAFYWAPLGKDFLGQSSRILFFHVPMAWVASVAFVTAGVYSVRYLVAGRRPDHDRAAEAAVELGLLFCVLATVTGAMWARTMWGAFWNWDPRQTSIAFALLFYAAYLALRGAIQDLETRRRISAAYATLGLVVAPFLFYVAPRLATFTLHPEPVINSKGEMGIEDPRMLTVLLVSAASFTALFFWVLNLARRASALADERFAGWGRNRDEGM